MKTKMILWALALTVSAAQAQNMIHHCTIYVTDKDNRVKDLWIPGEAPGMEGQSGAFASRTEMSIKSDFEAPGHEKWTLYVYGDIDGNGKTHIIHRVYSKKGEIPPQVDLLLPIRPADLIDNTLLTGRFKTTRGQDFFMQLVCSRT